MLYYNSLEDTTILYVFSNIYYSILHVYILFLFNATHVYKRPYHWVTGVITPIHAVMVGAHLVVHPHPQW